MATKSFTESLFGLNLLHEMKRERTRDDWFIFFAPKNGREKANDESLMLIGQCMGLLRRETTERGRQKLLQYRVMAEALSDKVRALLEGREALSLTSVTDYAGVNDLPVKGIDERQLERQLRGFFGVSNFELFLEERIGLDRRIPITFVILLVEYLIEHDFLPTTGHAPVDYASECQLADALFQFFAPTPKTRIDMRCQFEGHFYLYRKSQHWPGKYVKASLSITPAPLLDSDGNMRTPHEWALCTTESHHHNGEDGSAPVTETYIGVLSRKSGYPFIISSLTGETKRERGAPRFTIIHTTLYENGNKGRVTSMTGLAISTYGARGAVPLTVCIERTTAQPDLQELGLFAKDEQDSNKKHRIPQSVIARLEACNPL